MEVGHYATVPAAFLVAVGGIGKLTAPLLSWTVAISRECPTYRVGFDDYRPDVVTPVLVDDEMAVLLNGAEIFTYDFSSSGSPKSAMLEVPRATMGQLAGQTVTIQYRDIYDVVVKATEMWLIWVP